MTIIPIYHFYQYRTVGDGHVNLRVTTSSPSRVELYDGSSALVVVDADGDGILTGKGDSLVQDRDRNGFGDLALPGDQHEIAIVLMIQPSEPVRVAGLEVVIESLDEGEWVRRAVDTIRPRKP